MTGIRLCFWAAVRTEAIGDGHIRPAANQFSVSATQKSGSLWVVIAWVSVMTVSPSIEYGCPLSVKKFITAILALGSSVVFCASDSKSISVNVGMESGVSLYCTSRSKSDGTGSVSFSV